MFQSEKIQELDLNNPIFVFYLDVENYSQQSAQNYIENVRRNT